MLLNCELWNSALCISSQHCCGVHPTIIAIIDSINLGRQLASVVKCDLFRPYVLNGTPPFPPQQWKWRSQFFLPRYGFGSNGERCWKSVGRFEVNAWKTSWWTLQTCSSLVSLFSNAMSCCCLQIWVILWMATAVLALTRVDIINYWPKPSS